MKRIGAYCIDSTEVTNEQYEAFVTRLEAGAPRVEHASCADKDDHTPSEGWPSPPHWKTLPVRGVDWCDAWAYCAFAGKRLCGKLGGGALASTDTGRADASEWYRACSKAGTRSFPYGDQLIGGECATSNQIRAVAEGCEGGYLGIFDLVGNVSEWTDTCVDDGPSSVCPIVGGSALDDSARCSTVLRLYQRRARNPLIGFRCCAD